MSKRNNTQPQSFQRAYGTPEKLRNVGAYVVRRITNKSEVQIASSAILLAFARSFKGREYLA